MTLDDYAQAMLTAARQAGADQADVLVAEGRSAHVDVHASALEHVEGSEGTEIGLRVLVGQKQAGIAGSDLSKEALETMAARAVAMAKEAPDDPYLGLADPSQLSDRRDADGFELFDPDIEQSPDHLQDLALRAEAAALKVKDVRQVQSAGAGWSDTKISLATSHGFSGGYRRSSLGLSCVAISGSGTKMERDHCGEGRIFAIDLPSPEEIGLLAGERAAARAGANLPPTGAYPVLFDERISGSLISHMTSAINGATIVRGSGWLNDALGTEVLPKTLSLREDPHRVRISGSRPFDGEGLKTKARNVIDGGILTGWTLDLATARQLGMASTANASRSVGGSISPSLGNLELTGGTKSRQELLDDMGTGLLVTSLIGSTINPTTGDYSRGASGFWVEKGQIVRPVSGCTIAGNLRDMLKSIIPATDAKPHLSRQIPSLLVEGLTLAGE